MPDRHVIEGQDISIVALLQQGEPKDNEVKFKFKQDGKDLPEQSGNLSADKEQRTAKAATIKMKAPDVPADKEKSELVYSVVHEKRELSPAEKIMVWPKSGKLKAFEPDGKTPLKGFAFQVEQGTKKSAALRANDQGEAEFPLAPGETFRIWAVAPFVMEDLNDKKPRELVIKAVRKFTAMIEEPSIVALAGANKQFVNQPRDKDGQEGVGSRVKLKICAKEDHDKKNDPNHVKVAGAGVFAFVRATFNGHGGKPSARKEDKDEKKPKLIEGLELTEIKEDKSDPNVKNRFLAKLELKKDGKGEFEVELGLVGGDSCVLEIGSTDKFTDGCSIEYENWRKVFYEVRAPKTMVLPTKQIKGKEHIDLPVATLNRVQTLSEESYIQWELLSGTAFELTDEMKKKHLLPASFMGKGPANQTIFQLSDNQAEAYLGAWARAAGGKPLARFILCNSNLYQSSNARVGEAKGTVPDPIKVAQPTEALQVGINLPRGYWLPRSDHDGSKLAISWTAAHVPDPKPLTVTFAADGDSDNGAPKGKKTVRVEEVTIQPAPAPLDITWSSPAVGNIPTDLSSDHKKAIYQWLKGLATLANRRKYGNKLKFKITGKSDNDRRSDRMDNVRAQLQTDAAALNPFDPHPGVADDGTARTGQLDADLVVDMDRSNAGGVVINLPNANDDDPGKFVGPEGADKCPISVAIKYHFHGNGLGTAWPKGHARQGDLLIVNDPKGALCTADTILHELGHLFGLTPYKVADNGFAPGVKKVKDTSEDDADWKFNGDKGHYYDNAKGGIGRHCAYGLSDADKALPSYDNSAAASRLCVMFHSNSSQDNQRAANRIICPQCQHLQRAQDYTKYD